MVSAEEYFSHRVVGTDETAGNQGENEQLRLSDLGKLARRARRRVVRTARAEDGPTFASLLSDHLRVDIDSLELVEEAWPPHDLVNVQVGLDAWLASDGVRHEVVGMRGHRHMSFGLGDLLGLDAREDYVPRPGNVSRVRLATGPDGQVTSAVLAGVYLLTIDDLFGPGLAAQPDNRDHPGPTNQRGDSGDVHAVLMVQSGDPEEGDSSVRVHLAADRPGAAAIIANELRRLALHHNVYRGQVLSFEHEMFGGRASALRFLSRPHIDEGDVILPRETMAAIQRQVVGVARHRDRLLASGQHLKRGLLLYGPPGVGKTHMVRYLIGQLAGVTIIQLSGPALGAIGTACSVARTLQPAMIVVEDVDLIAEERSRYAGNPLLFELLNEMDGLGEDTDIVFLLTTNRAGVLEPALAARPGRVDQAVELRLPDADARRLLLALYRGGLDLDDQNLDEVIARTEGVTASFLKELLRRAAVLAADEADGPLRVTADQLASALDELLNTRNAMTRVLLGGAPARDGGDDDPGRLG